MGFRRTVLRPIPNLYDATIYRMVARYTGVVSKDKIICRKGRTAVGRVPSICVNFYTLCKKNTKYLSIGDLYMFYVALGGTLPTAVLPFLS